MADEKVRESIDCPDASNESLMSLAEDFDNYVTRINTTRAHGFEIWNLLQCMDKAKKEIIQTKAVNNT